MTEVSITATSSEYLAGTKREEGVAKAEDAKAKAKIINSKDRRYVFITKVSIRQCIANYVKPTFWKSPI